MSAEVEKFVSKSKQWKEEIIKLRDIILTTKLEENFKWRLPCYSFEDNNIVIIQPFKSCLGLMFFKGALLKDKKGILINNGPNSQSAKRLEFRSIQDIVKQTSLIKSYIKEAINIEKSGQKVEFKKKPASIPAELKEVFEEKPKLKIAFGSLTPGRQRAYIMHFNGAKQSATRVSRIKKCIPRILAGKGMADK